MQHRTLGQNGLSVSAIGFGAMVLSPGLYGAVDDAQSIHTLQHAVDAGIDFFDTADAYGVGGHNERLVGRALRGRREGVIVATKFGLLPYAGQPGRKIDVSYNVELRVHGRPEAVRHFSDQSLERLDLDVIDLYYMHYPDPGTPIEDTVGAMAELVERGKVRFLGLCNVTAEQVRRAHAVHPITAVQNEYSLWTRTPEREIIPVCRELGIGFVPWSPLGSGFLAGSVHHVDSGDFRSRAPRFQGDNLQTNLDRFAPLTEFAESKGITPAQLALAWLLLQGKFIVPIPGTRRADHVDANIRAAEVALSAADLEEIDRLAPAGLAVGASLL